MGGDLRLLALPLGDSVPFLGLRYSDGYALYLRSLSLKLSFSFIKSRIFILTHKRLGSALSKADDSYFSSL